MSGVGWQVEEEDKEEEEERKKKTTKTTLQILEIVKWQVRFLKAKAKGSDKRDAVTVVKCTTTKDDRDIDLEATAVLDATGLARWRCAHTCTYMSVCVCVCVCISNDKCSAFETPLLLLQAMCVLW